MRVERDRDLELMQIEIRAEMNIHHDTLTTTTTTTTPTTFFFVNLEKKFFADFFSIPFREKTLNFSNLKCFYLFLKAGQFWV